MSPGLVMAGTGTFYDHPIVDWPSSDPLVTAVGGTTLHLDAAGNRISPDTAWNDSQDATVEKRDGPVPWASTGGLSAIFARPSYQNSVAATVGSRRGVPDVSMSASLSGGILLYGSYTGTGKWDSSGGTSASCPELAGIIAIADQYAGRRLGLINPALYRLEAEKAPGIVDVGLPDQRFWRLDRHADYGPLDRLARHHISHELIIEQWEDILRVAGSLSTGTVRASELLRVLQGGGNPSRLGRAIAELGRIAKTLHLLTWIDSEQLRRTTSIGLDRHGGRHSVARVLFHGNQGELRQPYREGQEDQLGALGFALNALVVWNAQYMDDAMAYLRATGHEIADEDLKRLPPLQHEHIKMLGNFPFTLPHEITAGQRRPLRRLGDRA